MSRAVPRSDALLAVVLVGICLVELLDQHGGAPTGELVSGAVLAVGGIAPVAWRRRARRTAFTVVMVVGLCANLAEVAGLAVATVTSVSGALVMLGTVVASGSPRERLVAIGVVAGGLVVFLAVTGAWGPGSVVYFVGILGAAAVLGDILRRRASDASAVERARIADGLHDGLTGHLTSVVVQSASARHTLDTAPEPAREALRSIEEAGRSALAELRALVAPPGDAPASAVDLPGAVAVLARGARRSGSPFTVEIDGPARPVPAAVTEVARRLVEEAVTNAVRHAPRAPVRVGLVYAPRFVSVEVRNARAAAGSGDLPAGAGRGLVIAQERTLALGASFRAGPTPDGGFSVGARFPLDGPP